MEICQFSQIWLTPRCDNVSGPITLDINEDNFGIAITSAYGKYKLAGEPGGDYSNISEPSVADEFSVTSLSLLEGITKTFFATSNDKLRQAMTGI